MKQIDTDKRIITGTVTKIVNNTPGILGYKPGYVQVADDNGNIHNFINGSINQVPLNLRILGIKCKLTYQTTHSYGLWFVNQV